MFIILVREHSEEYVYIPLTVWSTPCLRAIRNPSLLSIIAQSLKGLIIQVWDMKFLATVVKHNCRCAFVTCKLSFSFLIGISFILNIFDRTSHLFTNFLEEWSSSCGLLPAISESRPESLDCSRDETIQPTASNMPPRLRSVRVSCCWQSEMLFRLHSHQFSPSIAPHTEPLIQSTSVRHYSLLYKQFWMSSPK